MYGYYNYEFFPFHVLGSIFMVVFWVFLVLLMVRLFRHLGRGGKHGRGMHDWLGGNALEILKERYAKGEITREQFEQMKKDIE
jgi:putative membrane protein